MERYELQDLYTRLTLFDDLENLLTGNNVTMLMGLENEDYEEVLNFVATSIYGYFYEDVVAYEGDTLNEVRDTFSKRLAYDISVKFPYWYRKYNEIKNLLTNDELSLFQTSKVTSSSQDQTNSAGGSLQKTATTPTGVSTGSTNADEINITIDDGDNSIETEGFVDKYTNAQQKYANASKILGTRSGTILREGSIEDILNILEKLPASFADEITRAVSKHFIFVYDACERNDTKVRDVVKVYKHQIYVDGFLENEEEIELTILLTNNNPEPYTKDTLFDITDRTNNIIGNVSGYDLTSGIPALFYNFSIVATGVNAGYITDDGSNYVFIPKLNINIQDAVTEIVL